MDEQAGSDNPGASASARTGYLWQQYALAQTKLKRRIALHRIVALVGIALLLPLTLVLFGTDSFYPLAGIILGLGLCWLIGVGETAELSTKYGHYRLADLLSSKDLWWSFQANESGLVTPDILGASPKKSSGVPRQSDADFQTRMVKLAAHFERLKVKDAPAKSYGDSTFDPLPLFIIFTVSLLAFILGILQSQPFQGFGILIAWILAFAPLALVISGLIDLHRLTLRTAATQAACEFLEPAIARAAALQVIRQRAAGMERYKTASRVGAIVLLAACAAGVPWLVRYVYGWHVSAPQPQAAVLMLLCWAALAAWFIRLQFLRVSARRYYLPRILDVLTADDTIERLLEYETACQMVIWHPKVASKDPALCPACAAARVELFFARYDRHFEALGVKPEISSGDFLTMRPLQRFNELKQSAQIGRWQYNVLWVLAFFVSPVAVASFQYLTPVGYVEMAAILVGFPLLIALLPLPSSDQVFVRRLALNYGIELVVLLGYIFFHWMTNFPEKTNHTALFNWMFWLSVVFVVSLVVGIENGKRQALIAALDRLAEPLAAVPDAIPAEPREGCRQLDGEQDSGTAVQQGSGTAG